MKQATSSSRTFTREEAFGIIESYFSSGLRPGQFYPAQGMSESQFYFWRSRYLQSQVTDKIYRVDIAKSVPVTGSESKTSPPLRITLPQRCKIIFTGRYHLFPSHVIH
jgi:hypothetical protein